MPPAKGAQGLAWYYGFGYYSEPTRTHSSPGSVRPMRSPAVSLYSPARSPTLGEGLRLAVAGAIAGLLLTFAVTRVLRGLLFETEPLDPVSLGTAALALVGAAVVATWLPATRAMRVQPIEVLRAQ